MFSFAQAGKSAKASNTAAGLSTEQLEREMADAICQDFERENKTRPLAELTKEEATTMMQNSMFKVMSARATEVEKILKKNKQDPNTAMREVGQRVGAQLAGNCPVAMLLFARLSGNKAAADAVGSVDAASLAISAAERPLIETLAADACTELGRLNAATPLAGQTTEARQTAVQQAILHAAKAHAKEIGDFYGADVFFDTEKLKVIGMKIGSLMASKCTPLIAEMGQ